MKFKNIFFWGGGGCQDGCERRIEVFVEIQKKKNIFFLEGGRVRVNVNREVKSLWKFKNKLFFGGSGREWGVGLAESGWM